MTELQSKLLEIMTFFHQVCSENNIRYYVLGGTCLGAVRHNGFIPWDDDIDVGLPREDYDRVISILKSGDFGKYRIECPLEKKDFVYSYCKLYDTSTTLTENTRYKTKRGIYLDIFPLDGVGNTYEEALNHFKRIEKYNNYISTKVCAINPHRKLYKNIAILIGRSIPEFIFGWRFAVKKAEKLCKMKCFDNCEYVGNIYGNWREKELSPRDVFGEPTLYNFEGIQVYGPQNADKYLSLLYGNYMQFPPKEKQITHHDFLFLDLNKSYKES